LRSRKSAASRLIGPARDREGIRRQPGSSGCAESHPLRLGGLLGRDAKIDPLLSYKAWKTGSSPGTRKDLFPLSLVQSDDSAYHLFHLTSIGKRGSLRGGPKGSGPPRVCGPLRVPGVNRTGLPRGYREACQAGTYRPCRLDHCCRRLLALALRLERRYRRQREMRSAMCSHWGCCSYKPSCSGR
jgi:hypothetical protein